MCPTPSVIGLNFMYYRHFLAHLVQRGHVSYCHHLASVVPRKLFQRSSPLKLLDQLEPNLVWIIDIYVFTAMLITYIKGGTPAQIFLERGSAMTRATFVIFWPKTKLASFIDWCYYGVKPLINFFTLLGLNKIPCLLYEQLFIYTTIWFKRNILLGSILSLSYYLLC